MSAATGALAPAAPVRAEPAAVGARAILELLCDHGSLQSLGSGVRSRRTTAPGGDGVCAGLGRVGGRPVACYAQDAAVHGGSLGEAQAGAILRTLELAERGGLPVIAFLDSAGARLQDATAALDGYGRIFRASVRLSRQVPQLAVVTSTAAGGGAYASALHDFVVMTDDAKLFLTGPRVVADACRELVTPEELGGRRVHERNGVCHAVSPTTGAAVRHVRELLGYLPAQVGGPAPRRGPGRAGHDDPAAAVPLSGRRVYDVRRVIEAVADAGSVLELAPRWARNVVCAFGRLRGAPAGFVASQPRHLGGVLDAASAEKAAWFVSACDRFGIPIVVLVDTPGFLPGRRQERDGVIRHGAGLLRAFGGASVPRVTVVLRKAYGGACIAMNSKGLGADAVFAWPGAHIGVMGAMEAVGVFRRRELAAMTAAERRRMAIVYAEQFQTAQVAAQEGFVDEVVEPADTRARVTRTLAALRPTSWEPA